MASTKKKGKSSWLSRKKKDKVETSTVEVPTPAVQQEKESATIPIPLDEAQTLMESPMITNKEV